MIHLVAVVAPVGEVSEIGRGDGRHGRGTARARPSVAPLGVSADSGSGSGSPARAVGRVVVGVLEQGGEGRRGWAGRPTPQAAPVAAASVALALTPPGPRLALLVHLAVVVDVVALGCVLDLVGRA